MRYLIAMRITVPRMTSWFGQYFGHLLNDNISHLHQPLQVVRGELAFVSMCQLSAVSLQDEDWQVAVASCSVTGNRELSGKREHYTGTPVLLCYRMLGNVFLCSWNISSKGQVRPEVSLSALLADSVLPATLQQKSSICFGSHVASSSALKTLTYCQIL